MQFEFIDFIVIIFVTQIHAEVNKWNKWNKTRQNKNISIYVHVLINYYVFVNFPSEFKRDFALYTYIYSIEFIFVLRKFAHLSIHVVLKK